jgi:hypothetical protein
MREDFHLHPRTRFLGMVGRINALTLLMQLTIIRDDVNHVKHRVNRQSAEVAKPETGG